MEEIHLITPDDDADGPVFLRVCDTIYTVPQLPDMELHQDDTVYFNGPLVEALYGGRSLSPRIRRLILFTLRRNPNYFTQLATRLNTTKSIGPVASVVRAADKKRVKGVSKCRK